MTQATKRRANITMEYIAEIDALCAQRDELVAALRCISAALNQNKTYPADVELARKQCAAALAKVQA